MYTPIVVGLLMLLATFCINIVIVVFFSVRAASNQNTLDHLAKIQGVKIPGDQS